MNTETIELFAPYIVIIVYAISCLKIFARTEDLKGLKADVLEYITEKFVSKDTYSDNHKALQDQMLQIHSDISEVKNLLIDIINRKGE